MARKKRWNEVWGRDGLINVDISNWKYFSEFINSKLLDFKGYIFRGQSRASWKLQPSLARLDPNISENRLQQHLEAFKYAVRGRRGANPATLASENDWWALGQHNGLATPLLDWSRSPYVGAFFAYEQQLVPPEQRVVWALQHHGVLNMINQTEDAAKKQGKPFKRDVEFFTPLSDENQRLVSQSALFSRTPLRIDLVQLVNQIFKGQKESVLIKIVLPDSDREFALKSLNRMNINHATLFPDLYGSALLCNTDLTIDNY